ncbi:helix-turn-helix domain-containing protein [Clostridium chromiireducens]|uniref:Helix-turn-helix domain-containing protein n=1 Tax=Clostridium chromiireducens TaxID=225345 RepID=A0A964RL36_9CLOT|nr:helix-turn-helix domain-containing protein [Clostridium chromiireducens]MVX63631.1 helix-turn-helix domain-containing protein [Clostridium chromiireducens]
MNQYCPIEKCNGILISTFDEEGNLINKCCECGYITYSNKEENASNNKSHIWIKNEFSKTKEAIIEQEDKIIVISYLKTIREKRGISQKQMAEIFGFSEQRYGNVERHYNAPSVVLISQFAYILNTCIGDLYKTVKVPKEVHEEMKYLKIQKSELVPFDELKTADNVLNSITDKSSKEYIKAKKEYDKLINSTATFLKQDELVENYYWEKYLEIKKDDDIIKFIQEHQVDDI